MKTIIEEKTNGNNNESQIKRAIYQNNDGTFEWMTYTKSGECKTLKTAMKKIGL